MNKQTSKTPVPKLRFPEFRATGEWEVIQLGTLGQTISGLSGKSGSDFGSGKPYVTYMQVFTSAWVDFTNCGRVIIADNEKQNTLRQGDILFTTSSETPDEVGFASVLLDSPSEPIYLNSFCFSFRPDDLSVLLPEFSRYLFHSPIYRKSIIVLAQGSTRYNISKGAFLNLKLPIAKNPLEQKKIADCLSSIDSLITAQRQKIDQLKAHKKGLMQQLFPAEGETIPKLRFPEFLKTDVWVEKQLKNVCQMQAGKFVSPSEINENINDDLYPCYGGNGLRGYTKSYTHFGKYSLIGRQGALCGNLMLATGKFHATEHAVIVTPKADIDTVWLFYLLMHLNLNQYATGQAQPGLSVENLEKVNIQIPKTEKEQRKIADCLSSIDDLITAQNQKIETLKTHKKGLMQQLFPYSD